MTRHPRRQGSARAAPPVLDQQLAIHTAMIDVWRVEPTLPTAELTARMLREFFPEVSADGQPETLPWQDQLTYFSTLVIAASARITHLTAQLGGPTE